MTLLELLPEIKLLPALDKIKLIRLLAEDLDSEPDLTLFDSPRTIQFATPYDSYGVARMLMEALADEDVA